MTLDIISYNHKSVFESAFKSAKNSIKIVSPFIEKGAVNLWLNAIKDNPNMDCKLITKFSDKDFLCGASSLEVLKNLIAIGVKIIAIKNLHTKLYLFDNNIAIIGSANFTSGGFSKNVELSVQLKENPDEINQLCEYYDNLLNENKNFEVTEERINNKILELEKYKEAKKALENLPTGSYGGKGKVSINHSFHNLTGVLKFESSARERAAGDEPYKGNKYSDFYFTSTPYTRGRPIMLSDDKLLFITIMSFNTKGEETPMIIGRARTYGFDENNLADKAMIQEHDWTKHFSYYVKLYNIEVIATEIKNGISLHEIKHQTEIPYYRQQSYVEITSETKDYINDLLEKKFDKFGKSVLSLSNCT